MWIIQVHYRKLIFYIEPYFQQVQTASPAAEILPVAPQTADTQHAPWITVTPDHGFLVPCHSFASPTLWVLQ